MTPGLVGGRYRVVGELGRGATSVVYEARDETLKAAVALKLLAPHLARDPRAVAELRRELLAARSIVHDGVAQVFDLHEEDGRAFMVMELGRGGTLKVHLLLKGPLPPELLELLMTRLAGALAACHERGILHRDLKPSNVLFDADARDVKLIDFGVARTGGEISSEDAGSVVGTPEYMAPEQFDDPAPDPRSDIYAAGALFFEAATGIPPIVGTTIPEILRKAREGVRVTPRSLGASIGPATEEIIMKALAADPAERHQTARELLLAIEGQGAEPMPPPPDEARAGTCPSCGSARVSDLPFCPRCVEGLQELDRPGAWVVSVTPLRAPGRRRRPIRGSVHTHLERLLPSSFELRSIAEWPDPFLAIDRASEPLARWIAAELRKAGMTATAHRKSVSSTLGTMGFMLVVATVLTHLLTVGWFGMSVARLDAAAELLPVTLLCLALVAFIIVKQVVGARHRWIARVPLGPPRRWSSALLGAALLQSRLASRRCRALGRDVIVEAERMHRSGGDPTRLVHAGFALLHDVDRALATLREGSLPRQEAAERRDAVVRGTDALLQLLASLRLQHRGAIRPGVRAGAGSSHASIQTLLERVEAHAAQARAEP